MQRGDKAVVAQPLLLLFRRFTAAATAVFLGGNRSCLLLTGRIRDNTANPHQKLPPLFVSSRRRPQRPAKPPSPSDAGRRCCWPRPCRLRSPRVCSRFEQPRNDTAQPRNHSELPRFIPEPTRTTPKQPRKLSSHSNYVFEFSTCHNCCSIIGYVID